MCVQLSIKVIRSVDEKIVIFNWLMSEVIRGKQRGQKPTVFLITKLISLRMDGPVEIKEREYTENRLQQLTPRL